MSRLNSKTREVWAKIALFGSSNESCAEVFQGISDNYPDSKFQKDRLGDIEILKTDILWPQDLPNDWKLKVCLYGMPELATYNAVNELLLKDVDGVVFLADVSEQESLQSAVESMKLMVFNLQRQEYDLQSLPVSLLYHRIEAHSVFQPELMDQFLGIPQGSVPRFCTRTGDDPAVLSEAVHFVSGILHGKLSQELNSDENQEAVSSDS